MNTTTNTTTHTESNTSPTVRGDYDVRTRLFHAALAAAVVLQLITSQFMHSPGRNRPGDWLFEVHEYSGLVALVLAFGFWVHVYRRRQGTAPGALLPWFDRSRRAAVGRDIAAHWQAIRRRRVPAYSTDSALASAVHGLGLLLMLAMATTGAIFYVGLYLGIGRTSLFALDIEIHELVSNLVWAYLIGHACVALLHHYLRQSSLREMWSARRSAPRL